MPSFRTKLLVTLTTLATIAMFAWLETYHVDTFRAEPIAEQGVDGA